MTRLALNTRSVALISTFAALAIILNAIRIPVIYFPGWFYTFCDIPVLIAFILYRVKVGLLVEAVNIIGQEMFFPVGPAGTVIYPMGFLTLLLMFSGVYLANKIVTRRAASGKQIGEKRRTLYYTGFATALRGAIMPIIDFMVLYNILLPLVLGTIIPEAFIIALVPSFILYNITSALYAVPIAYIIAKRASRYLRIETNIL